MSMLAIDDHNIVIQETKLIYKTRIQTEGYDRVLLRICRKIEEEANDEIDPDMLRSKRKLLQARQHEIIERLLIEFEQYQFAKEDAQEHYRHFIRLNQLIQGYCTHLLHQETIRLVDQKTKWALRVAPFTKRIMDDLQEQPPNNPLHEQINSTIYYTNHCMKGILTGHILDDSYYHNWINKPLLTNSRLVCFHSLELLTILCQDNLRRKRTQEKYLQMDVLYVYLEDCIHISFDYLEEKCKQTNEELLQLRKDLESQQNKENLEDEEEKIDQEQEDEENKGNKKNKEKRKAFPQPSEALFQDLLLLLPQIILALHAFLEVSCEFILPDSNHNNPKDNYQDNHENVSEDYSYNHQQMLYELQDCYQQIWLRQSKAWIHSLNLWIQRLTPLPSDSNPPSNNLLPITKDQLYDLQHISHDNRSLIGGLIACAYHSFHLGSYFLSNSSHLPPPSSSSSPSPPRTTNKTNKQSNNQLNTLANQQVVSQGLVPLETLWSLLDTSIALSFARVNHYSIVLGDKGSPGCFTISDQYYFQIIDFDFIHILETITCYFIAQRYQPQALFVYHLINELITHRYQSYFLAIHYYKTTLSIVFFYLTQTVMTPQNTSLLVAERDRIFLTLLDCSKHILAMFFIHRQSLHICHKACLLLRLLLHEKFMKKTMIDDVMGMRLLRFVKFFEFAIPEEDQLEDEEDKPMPSYNKDNDDKNSQAENNSTRPSTVDSSYDDTKQDTATISTHSSTGKDSLTQMMQNTKKSEHITAGQYLAKFKKYELYEIFQGDLPSMPDWRLGDLMYFILENHTQSMEVIEQTLLLIEHLISQSQLCKFLLVEASLPHLCQRMLDNQPDSLYMTSLLEICVELLEL